MLGYHIWINLKLTIILGMGAVTLQWSLHVVLPICLVVIESWSPHFKYDFPLDPFREELDGPRVKKHFKYSEMDNKKKKKRGGLFPEVKINGTSTIGT